MEFQLLLNTAKGYQAYSPNDILRECQIILAETKQLRHKIPVLKKTDGNIPDEVAEKFQSASYDIKKLMESAEMFRNLAAVLATQASSLLFLESPVSNTSTELETIKLNAYQIAGNLDVTAAKLYYEVIDFIENLGLPMAVSGDYDHYAYPLRAHNAATNLRVREEGYNHIMRDYHACKRTILGLFAMAGAQLSHSVA